MPSPVLLTGASGFIAQHITNILLANNFPVIGTVRSQEKANTLLSHFGKLYPEANLVYEIVPEIAVSGCFDQVIQKYQSTVKYVIHTASPFSFHNTQLSTEQQFFNPATIGTRSILEACLEHGSKVKTVVITSSFAAITNKSRAGDATFVHSETTWNPLNWEQARTDQKMSYAASKKEAEQLAWEFMRQNKPKFTLTTVCPPFVFGPQMFPESVCKDNLNTSADMVAQAMRLTNEAGPFDTPAYLVCDVRDVALCHVLPLTKPQLAGERLMPMCGNSPQKRNNVNAKMNQQKILNILNKVPELKGKIVAGDTDRDNDSVLMATAPYYNSDRTCQLTGITFTSCEKSITDAARQLAYI